MNSIGQRLREERERIGLNQSEFGELASVSKTTQINYEKGVRRPDTQYLSALIEAGVDVCYLLTGKRTDHLSDELSLFADAYEAIDIALIEARKVLDPKKKRQAAEALYMALKNGEIRDLKDGANLLLSAA